MWHLLGFFPKVAGRITGPIPSPSLAIIVKEIGSVAYILSLSRAHAYDAIALLLCRRRERVERDALDER